VTNSEKSFDLILFGGTVSTQDAFLCEFELLGGKLFNKFGFVKGRVRFFFGRFYLSV